MADSFTPQNERIIEDNIVKDIRSLNNGKSTKIVLKIHSKYTQIGDDNKIFGVVFPSSSRKETEENTLVKRLDLNSETGAGEIFIDGKYIQIMQSGDNELEIIVESREASLVQIGDRCELHFGDETRNDTRKTEENSEYNAVSIRPDIFGPQHGTRKDTYQNQFKQRQKKPQNRKKKCVTKTKAKKADTNRAAVDSPECLQLCDQFAREVQKFLHPIRDDGKWSLYDETWNELMKKCGKDPIWNIFLRLEYGIRICYNAQSEFEYLDEAEKILYQEREKIERLEDLSIKQICAGRLYCYLGTVYRRKKLYGRAENCMENAQSIFQNTGDHSFLYDKAIFYYEKAILSHELDENGVNNEQAKKSFEICAELCRQLKTQEGWDFVKKGKFALCKKVIFLLAGSTKKGRLRHICDRDIEEAKKCLDDLDSESNSEDECTISVQFQRLLAKSDYYFRTQDLRQAKEFARQAIELADEHGFDYKPGKSRFEDLQASIPSSPLQPRGHKKIKFLNSEDLEETVPSRESCDADVSASQSTENSDVGC